MLDLDVWGDVVGQDHAVAQLAAAAVQPVHAYLLVGPSGSGKRAAARAFAALLLAAGSEGEAAERHARLALAEAHPDLHIIEPTTAQGRIDAPAAREIVHQAAVSPAEGSRKVLVLEDFHLIDRFGAILLKYVEEPPASTFFVILAEDVPPELVTIASRSVRIDLGPVPLHAVVDRLVAEGVGAAQAVAIAAAANGDLDRARLLATDSRFAVRADALAAMPGRLDGTGARAAELAGEVKALIDDAQDVIDARHAPRRPSSRSASSATASGGVARRRSRTARSARSAATAPPSCASPSPPSPAPTATPSPRPATPTGSSPACTASTPPRSPSSASRTSRSCCSPCSRSCRRSRRKVLPPARIAQW